MRTIAERARLVLVGLAFLLTGFIRPDPQPLIQAAKNNDGLELRGLIEEGVDVNAAHGDGTTALHWVSYWNDVESAQLLIRAGADVNATNDLGATPLWAAALNGSAAMTRTLLSAGANPNSALLLGETVLMQASRTGSAEVVEMLLRAGADVNARGPIQETTSCPMPGVYEFQRFEPNVRPGLKDVELERIAGMRCGLQAGNQTALMWAVSNRHPEVVALLLKHGADVHARSDVWSQLQAVNPNPVFDNQRAFLHGGSTPLLFAARVSDLESAKLLVAAGADVNDTNAWGLSAVALAAFSNSGDLVRFLLAQGADPNPPPQDEVLAPLHAAIMHQDEVTVAALLAHGADPNAPLRAWTPRVRSSPNRPGRWYNFQPATVGATPFWIAARWGTPAMMRMLAEHGADPLVVHTSNYYGGLEGIDAFLFSERTTALMAALDMGGQGNPWVAPDPSAATGGGPRAGRRPEAEVLEAVKIAAELGVDVNAVNAAVRTCDVPWARTYRPGARLDTCVSTAYSDRAADQNFARRTALEAAIALRYDSVVEFLLAQGATRSEGEPASRRPALGQ